MKTLRGSAFFPCALFLCVLAAALPGATDSSVAPESAATPPRCNRTPLSQAEWGGAMRDYLVAMSEHWLIPAPAHNPGLLDMFAERERKPYRKVQGYHGEFAGKYLTGAIQVLRLTQDPALRAHLTTFVNRLIERQADDGYLGPYSKQYQLTGRAPVEGNEDPYTWETWNHYHIMLGLLLWLEETGDPKALAAVVKIGDLLCKTFFRTPGGMLAISIPSGNDWVNSAPVHALCLLYQKTKTQRYLDLADQIIDKEFPMSGDYFRVGLAGKDFYQIRWPRQRWESLHSVIALAEMYWITGKDDYRRAFEQLWWSLVKWDRHNTGAYSSDEKAVGNPYHRGAIETCCVVAWAAMSVEMLRLTGNSVVADELELTLLNAIFGYQSRTGNWSAYNTPMDGRRIANVDQLGWQKGPGTADFNCCSANAPRGLGLVSDWALMQDQRGLLLNWYGPSTLLTQVKEAAVTLRQETDYPRTGLILLHVTPQTPIPFDLRLRIPCWSRRNYITLNDTLTFKDVPAGEYFSLNRTWEKGDRLKLELDMSLHFWVGEKEYAGRTSVYRGPLLLAYRHEKGTNITDDPILDASRLEPRLVEAADRPPGTILIELSAVDDNKVYLRDFDSAGENGEQYSSWLKVTNVALTPFSPSNPLRSGKFGR